MEFGNNVGYWGWELRPWRSLWFFCLRSLSLSWSWLRGTFSTFTNPSPLLHIDACPRFLTHLPNAFLKDHSLGYLGWNLGRTSVFKFSIILMLTFTKCTISCCNTQVPRHFAQRKPSWISLPSHKVLNRPWFVYH